MKRKELTAIMLIMALDAMAASSGNVRSDLNEVISSILLPIFAGCSIIGIISGVVRNWDLIIDRSSEQKKQGLINLAVFAAYGMLAGTILSVVARMVSDITLSI